MSPKPRKVVKVSEAVRVRAHAAAVLGARTSLTRRELATAERQVVSRLRADKPEVECPPEVCLALRQVARLVLVALVQVVS